jgi:hypothetical protein
MAAVGGPVPPAVHEPATGKTGGLRKGRPAYPGFPAQGASAPTGGRAWPRALPRQAGRRPPRKRSIGICGAWSSEGKGRGPKGSTGEGTPRRDPGGLAGRSRPNGRVGGHQRVTATAATAYLWRRGPAHWTSHGAARPHGASHGTPGRLLGPHCQPRPKGGKERETLGLRRTRCVCR